MRLLCLLSNPKYKKRLGCPNLTKIETVWSDFYLFRRDFLDALEKTRRDEISLISLFLSLSFSRGGWKGTTTTNQLHPVLLLLLLLSSSSTSSPCFPLVSRIKTRNARDLYARVRSRRLFYSISKTDEQLSHNITQGRTPDILSRACTLASFLYERDLFVPKKRRS